jgi:hypothetical protein
LQAQPNCNRLKAQKARNLGVRKIAAIRRLLPSLHASS